MLSAASPHAAGDDDALRRGLHDADAVRPGGIGPVTAGWASHSQLRSLRHAGPGRIPLGKVGPWRVSLPPRHSLLVLGQTQSGKTTRLAAPALRVWQGPAVSTSIKTDLLALTIQARRAQGPVWVFEPTGPMSAGWNPLDLCQDWQRALQMAAWMTEAAQVGESRDPNWWDWAQDMLAPTLYAAARKGATMVDVVRWLAMNEFADVALGIADEPAAVQAWTAFIRLEAKQRSGVLSMTRPILKAFIDPMVAQATSRSDFSMAELLAENGTLYIIAPSHEQARLRPLFVALLKSVFSHAHEHGPLDSPLLCVLDEAANVAPLGDLDTIASTCAGMGIQLVTVFQDGGQIRARYGRDLAESIWTNHAARIILPIGMLDMDTLERISQLLGDERVAVRNRDGSVTVERRPVMPVPLLAQMPRGSGVLLGSHPPARLRLTQG